jgi:NADPH:quinone reductase-like Zn-dependent oxidoreductase
VLGHDVAGVVTRAGSAVRGIEVGIEVYARLRDLRIGGFAEFVAIDQDDVAPKPESLTFPEAAKALGVRYQFFFMRANGSRLRDLGVLYDKGELRPVVDRIFPFDRTLDAMAHVEQGRVKAGKVVVSMVSGDSAYGRTGIEGRAG